MSPGGNLPPSKLSPTEVICLPQTCANINPCTNTDQWLSKCHNGSMHTVLGYLSHGRWTEKRWLFWMYYVLHRLTVVASTKILLKVLLTVYWDTLLWSTLPDITEVSCDMDTFLWPPDSLLWSKLSPHKLHQWGTLYFEVSREQLQSTLPPRLSITSSHFVTGLDLGFHAQY